MKHYTWPKKLFFRVKKCKICLSGITGHQCNLPWQENLPPHRESWGLSQLAEANDIKLSEKVLLTNISTLDVIIPLMGATRCWVSGFPLILSSEFLYLKLILILSFLQDYWVNRPLDLIGARSPGGELAFFSLVSSQLERSVFWGRGRNPRVEHVMWSCVASLASSVFPQEWLSEKERQAQSNLAGPQARQNQGLDQYLPKKLVWRAKSGK